MNTKQLKQLITFVLWRMEVNLNRDQRITQDDHTPEREGAKYNSTAAINLLLGTAFVESDCGHYLRQLGGGPARGIFQMERMTHDDLWYNYINHRPELEIFMRGELPQTTAGSKFDNLEYNLRYAIMMTRLHYRRVVEPISNLEDFSNDKAYIVNVGDYWKRYYNTKLGAGSVTDFVNKWEKYA